MRGISNTTMDEDGPMRCWRAEEGPSVRGREGTQDREGQQEGACILFPLVGLRSGDCVVCVWKV